MSAHSITRFQYEDLDIKGYLSQIRSYPSLAEVEEVMLTQRVYQDQDRDAAEKLVMSHMKLVVKIAYDMRRYGAVLIDLIGEGSIGLMHAVKKYDPAVGIRFASYAQWWIKAYIHEYIIKTWSLVKIGTTASQKKLFFHLKKIKEKILLAHNKQSLSDADCKTIANELSVSSTDVKEMDIRLSHSLSLDTRLSHEENNESTMLDFVADGKQDTELLVLETDINTKQQKLLEEALSKLNEREASIIRSRHFKDIPDTLAVLSEQYNISRERIRQVEEVALKKITEYCRKHYKGVGTRISTFKLRDAE